MLTLQQIQAAQQTIGRAVDLTPCKYSGFLSRLTSAPIYLKLENLQKTGSFKIRGAINKLSSLTPEERRRGVIAASAGNHAQGVRRRSPRSKPPASPAPRSSSRGKPLMMPCAWLGPSRQSAA